VADDGQKFGIDVGPEAKSDLEANMAQGEAAFQAQGGQPLPKLPPPTNWHGGAGAAASGARQTQEPPEDPFAPLPGPSDMEASADTPDNYRPPVSDLTLPPPTKAEAKAPPGFFDQFGAEFLYAAPRGFAELGRSLMMISGGQLAAVDDVVSSFLSGKKQSPSQDALKKAVDSYTNNVINYFLPEDPSKSGLGSQVVGDVISGVVPMVLGPVYGLPALIAKASTDEYYNARKAGQDIATAAALTATAAATTYLGVKLPLKNPAVWKRIASAIGFNEALTGASEYLSKQILDSGGYQEAAKKIDPTDPRVLLSTAVAGAIYGWLQKPGDPKFGGKPGAPTPPAGATPGSPGGPGGPAPPAGPAAKPGGPAPPASAMPSPNDNSVVSVQTPGAAPAPTLTDAGPNSAVSTGAPGATATVPTPEGLKLPDVPTTESAQTLRAHFNDLRDNNTPRTAVFVTHGSIAHMSGSPDANATVVKNQMNLADSQGRVVDFPNGVLIVRTQAGAKAIKERLAKGEDPQAVIGSVTVGGSGKTADQTAVVQGKDAQGNTAVERTVRPDEVEQASQDMTAQGKTPVVTTPEAALQERINDVSRERNTPTLFGIFTTPKGKEVPVHVLPGAPDGMVRVQVLDVYGEPSKQSAPVDVPAAQVKTGDDVKRTTIVKPAPAGAAAGEKPAPKLPAEETEKPAAKPTETPATPTESAGASPPKKTAVPWEGMTQSDLDYDELLGGDLNKRAAAAGYKPVVSPLTAEKPAEAAKPAAAETAKTEPATAEPAEAPKPATTVKVKVKRSRKPKPEVKEETKEETKEEAKTETPPAEVKSEVDQPAPKRDEKPSPKKAAIQSPEDVLRAQLATHEAEENQKSNLKNPNYLADRRESMKNFAIVLRDAANKLRNKVGPALVERANKITGIVGGFDTEGLKTKLGLGTKTEAETAKGQITHPTVTLVNDEMHRIARLLLGEGKPGDEESILRPNERSIAQAVVRAKAGKKARKARTAATEETEAETPPPPEPKSDAPKTEAQRERDTKRLQVRYIAAENGADFEAAKLAMEQHLHEDYPDADPATREEAMQSLHQRRLAENSKAARPKTLADEVEPEEEKLSAEDKKGGGDTGMQSGDKNILKTIGKKAIKILGKVFDNRMNDQWKRLANALHPDTFGEVDSGIPKSSHEVLNRLLNVVRDPELRGILQHLRRTVPDLPVYHVSKAVNATTNKVVPGAAGLLDPRWNFIQFVNTPQWPMSLRLEYLAHEFGHAATQYEVERNPTGRLATSLEMARQVLINRLKRRYGEGNIQRIIEDNQAGKKAANRLSRDLYGLQSTEEMMQEGLVNPDFQAQIAQSERYRLGSEDATLQGLGIMGNDDSLLGRIMGSIGQFFGVKDPHLLRHIMGLTEAMADKQRQNINESVKRYQFLGQTSDEFHQVIVHGLIKLHGFNIFDAKAVASGVAKLVEPAKVDTNIQDIETKPVMPHIEGDSLIVRQLILRYNKLEAIPEGYRTESQRQQMSDLVDKIVDQRWHELRMSFLSSDTPNRQAPTEADKGILRILVADDLRKKPGDDDIKKVVPLEEADSPLMRRLKEQYNKLDAIPYRLRTPRDHAMHTAAWQRVSKEMFNELEVKTKLIAGNLFDSLNKLAGKPTLEDKLSGKLPSDDEGDDDIKKVVPKDPDEDTPISKSAAIFQRAFQGAKNTGSSGIDAVRRLSANLSTVSQIIKSYRRDFGHVDDVNNPMNKYEDVNAARDKELRRIHAITNPVARAWAKLPEDMNGVVGDLIRDTTSWKLDPRLPTFDDNVSAGKSGHDAENRFKELKRRYDNDLSIDAREVFGAQFEANKKLLQESRKAGINASLRAFGDKWEFSDAQRSLLASAKSPEDMDRLIGKGKLVDVGEDNTRLRKALDQFANQAEIIGPYAHLGRYGEYVVHAKPEGTQEFTTQAQEPGPVRRVVTPQASESLARSFENFVNNLSPNSSATYKLLGDKHTVDYKADYTSFHKSRAEAEEHLKQVEAAGLDPGIVTTKIQSGQYGGINSAATDLIATALGKMRRSVGDDGKLDPGHEALIQALHSAMLQASASRSAYAGSQLARKATAGVKGHEMRRSFTDYAQSTAWHIAQLNTLFDQASALEGLQSAARESHGPTQAAGYRRGAAVTALGKHMLDDARNYGEKNPFNQFTSKLGMMAYLGSPSHAVIWGTQNFTTGIPLAMARFGARAAPEFGRAMMAVISPSMRQGLANAFKRGNNSEDIDNAIKAVLLKHPQYKRWVEGSNSAFDQLTDRGVLGHSYADALKDLADQSDPLLGRYDWPIRKTLEIVRLLPNMADAFNRVSTALVALEMTKGDIRKTADFVRDVHADYSQQNKPLIFKRFNRLGLNSVTMFKTYTQNMFHLLYSNVKASIVGGYGLAKQAVTGTPVEPGTAERTAEAAKTVAGMVTGMALFGGVYGAIGLEPLRLGIWVYHKLFDDEGEYYDLKNSVNRWVEDVVQWAGGSEKLGRDVSQGIIPRLAGIDLSSRMGLADLAFHEVPDLATNSKDNWEQFIYNESGTVTDFMASHITQFHKALEDGDTFGMISSLNPLKAYQDGLKGWQYHSQGYTNSFGAQLTEPSDADWVKQQLGFKPASVADAQEHGRVDFNYRNTIKSVRQSIINSLVAGKDNAEDRRQRFNEMHPTEKITNDNVRREMKLRNRLEQGLPEKDPDLQERQDF
jgi:hypothetical protein